MAETSIEWTDRSWNPIRGCTRVSEGCRHCYAERVAARFSGPGLPYEGLARKVGGKARWTGELRFVEGALLEPLRRRKPTTWFVNSMSDLFHEKVPDAWIDRIFAVMALAPQHTFQVLTKRPERMRAYFADPSTLGRVLAASNALVDQACEVANATGKRVLIDCGMTGRLICAPSGPKWLPTWPLPNVWLGTSCEDQATADARVPELLATPAAVRFISAEPLLASIDFTRIEHSGIMCTDALRGVDCNRCGEIIAGERPHLDQIIVGGESGPGARPMHPAWPRAIRDQCAAAGVAFFMKQMSGAAKSRMPAIPADLMIREMPHVTR